MTMSGTGCALPPGPGGHLFPRLLAQSEYNAGLRARIVQRLLALNSVIWFNWQIGAPVKRSLIAYDH